MFSVKTSMSMSMLSLSNIKRFASSSSSSSRRICTKMSFDSSAQLTHTITLPSQLDEPVQILAGPGVSDSEFSKANKFTMVSRIKLCLLPLKPDRNKYMSSCILQQLVQIQHGNNNLETVKHWLQNIQSETGFLANGSMSLRQVLIQGVDMFGRRIGFLKFKADVIDKETGKQVEEEIGIRLNLDDMVDLTAFLDPNTGCKVFPSPGGCDEELSLLLYRGRVSEDVIKQLHGKETGLHEHGEFIKVRVVPYETLWRVTADAKALMAIALYEMAKREGMLPPLKC